MNHHGQHRTAGAPVPFPGLAAASSPPSEKEVPASSTRLSPVDAFPADLGSLALVELQILHSRVCLQLDAEHLDALEGTHPVTLDRHQELVDALDAYQGAVAVTAHE
ncbi:hypothetical protein ACT4S5_01790 [Kocuria oceani]|uniref:hypothetical protein n=1 Tax=Kocuria oceani TaxID=988827 RepID=UPI0040361CCF